MKTKNILLVIIAFITLISIAPSCKKYEDGPAISLRTKKARLCGDWKIESSSFDGVDITSALNANFGWNIEKDGTYQIVAASTATGTMNSSGKWKFGEDKDDVYLTDGASGLEMAYRILRLANKELWVRYTTSDGKFLIYKFKQ